MLRQLVLRCRKPVRWYVMTSAATDGATRAFFAEKAYFGLQQSQIVFFMQVAGCPMQLPCSACTGRHCQHAYRMQ